MTSESIFRKYFLQTCPKSVQRKGVRKVEIATQVSLQKRTRQLAASSEVRWHPATPVLSGSPSALSQGHSLPGQPPASDWAQCGYHGLVISAHCETLLVSNLCSRVPHWVGQDFVLSSSWSGLSLPNPPLSFLSLMDNTHPINHLRSSLLKSAT